MGRLEDRRVAGRPAPGVGGRLSVGELAAREWLAPHSGVTLRWVIRAEEAAMVTDAAKLQIVVSNLVTNALKYTREVASPSPWSRRPRGVVDFEVTDTGPGIPEEQLAHMRKPFHETSARRATASAGSVSASRSCIGTRTC
jgi:signal transduction histidine kinase